MHLDGSRDRTGVSCPSLTMSPLLFLISVSYCRWLDGDLVGVASEKFREINIDGMLYVTLLHVLSI